MTRGKSQTSSSPTSSKSTKSWPRLLPPLFTVGSDESSCYPSTSISSISRRRRQSKAFSLSSSLSSCSSSSASFISDENLSSILTPTTYPLSNFSSTRNRISTSLKSSLTSLPSANSESSPPLGIRLKTLVRLTIWFHRRINWQLKEFVCDFFK